MSNGLDALDARADRAKRKPPPPPSKGRRVLPPQHPAPAPTAAAVRPQEATGALEVPEGQQQFPGLSGEPAVTAVVAPVAASAPQASASTEAIKKDELRKVAVYLDESQDAALEALRYLGTSQRPRLDVSKSAVVRLALKRLLTDLSHEEIVRSIAATPTDPQTPGRKRR